MLRDESCEKNVSEHEHSPEGEAVGALQGRYLSFKNRVGIGSEDAKENDVHDYANEVQQHELRTEWMSGWGEESLLLTVITGSVVSGQIKAQTPKARMKAFM